MAAPRSLLKGFAKVVADTEPVPGKRLTISDPDTRGLYLRVSPTGHKSFTVVARDPTGKQVWAVVGNCDDLTLEEARELARAGVKRIKAGEEAFPKVAPAPAPATFKAISERFINEYVKDPDRPLRSGATTERIFRTYLWGRLGDRPFAAVRRGEIRKALREIKEQNGPVMADRVLSAVSKLCNWYALEDDDYVSPIIRGMAFTKSSERARKRVLSPDEIRLLWKAAPAAGTYGAFLQVALLTAQRRAKVMAMRWQDIDEKGVWTIPAEAREKSNAGALQLPAAALAIITARPKVKGNPYVFAGNGERHFVPENKAKVAFDAAMAKQAEQPIPPWTIHDLRRTAKTIMSRSGVQPHVSEQVLGHTIKGVEGVYEQHDWQSEKGRALKKLAGAVELVLNPPNGNVVRIRKAS